MSPATAAAAPVVQTTARAFGLKSIADSVASALEDRFARMLPQLEVQVVGFRGAFTGRLWWVASAARAAASRDCRFSFTGNSAWIRSKTPGFPLLRE